MKRWLIGDLTASVLWIAYATTVHRASHDPANTVDFAAETVTHEFVREAQVEVLEAQRLDEGRWRVAGAESGW